MKGAELPVNTIIIVVLAILVLIALITIYSGVSTPARGSVSLDAAKNSACLELTNRGCYVSSGTIMVENFDANKDDDMITGDPEYVTLSPTQTVSCDGNGGDNLARLCACYYGIALERECREKICHCSVQ